MIKLFMPASTIISAQHVVCRLSMFVLLLSWALPATSLAQIESAIQMFDKGNDFYRTGDYQSAVTSFEDALSSGYSSEALLYNLGNAYFRLDNLGQAIRYYEKARLLSPDNPELLHNLEFAQNQAVDKFSRLPEPAIVTWWESVVEKNGGSWFFWLGFVFYVLAIAVIVVKMRQGGQNPWLRRARAVTLLLATLFLVAAFYASISSVEVQQAVILDEQIALRQEPNETSASELNIHAGLVVDILSDENQWREVRLPNGARGWVPAESTGDI